uniref:Cytochrome P450 n=1 Tax=Leersia perrieri TaxID=77586 RepID=A0A0D9X604_9ORYZ
MRQGVDQEKSDDLFKAMHAAADLAGVAKSIAAKRTRRDLIATRWGAMPRSAALASRPSIERKEAVDNDVLPSGHTVRAGDSVLVSVYSMGRLVDVWGEDCREYRPERWLIDENGDGNYKVCHVPSYKFMSFNTGPRSCLGKKVAVATITPVVATLLWNFDVEVMAGHVVEPKLSVVMQMKNGFLVKV